MTFHIVVNMENGTRLAVAAFSTAERAQAYLQKHELKEARVDFFDPGDQVPQNPRTIYVAQRFVRDGVYELGGYFFSRYEAERAVSGLGFERRLEIDVTDQVFTPPPLPVETVVEEKPKVLAELAPKAKAAARQARQAAEIGAAGFPFGQVLLLVLLLAGIAGSYWLFSRTPTIHFGEGEVRVEWLPTTARDVSFFRQGSFEAYEFTISEEGFRLWARSFGSEPGPVPLGGVFVPRYLMLATAAGAATPPDAKGGTRATSIEILDGLYWTSVPPGAVVTLAWNRATNRAYLYRQ